eukprot:927442-Amphidinium_carterae.1
METNSDKNHGLYSCGWDCTMSGLKRLFCLVIHCKVLRRPSPSLSSTNRCAHANGTLSAFIPHKDVPTAKTSCKCP